MATIVDVPPTTDEEITSIDELKPEAEQAPVEEPVEAEVVEQVEEDLPEKYRGKSASDIARMHQELEKRLGEQSNEVGELRRHFDEYVQSSIAKANSAPEAPAEEIDFFADPQAAVAKAIENHPSLQQAQAVAAEMAKSQALAKLQQSHPDMQEVLREDGFKEWVGKSEFRKELFKSADANYDFAAADELLTLYKERKGTIAQTAQVEKQAQKQEIKKASTGSARSNPEGTAVRKTYRRRDIIELMNTDPKRYEALMPEIMKAYSEGRVK